MVGQTVRIRGTDESARVLAVVDASGTLIVEVEGEEPFQVARDDVESAWERHAACACCG